MSQKKQALSTQISCFSATFTPLYIHFCIVIEPLLPPNTATIGV